MLIFSASQKLADDPSLGVKENKGHWEASFWSHNSFQLLHLKDIWWNYEMEGEQNIWHFNHSYFQPPNFKLQYLRTGGYNVLAYLVHWA